MDFQKQELKKRTFKLDQKTVTNDLLTNKNYKNKQNPETFENRSDCPGFISTVR